MQSALSDPGQVDQLRAGAYLALSKRLWDAGHAQQAITACREALLLDPQNVSALGRLSHFFERANQLDDAEGTVLTALQIAPDDPDINLTAAKLEGRRRQTGKAIARLRRFNLKKLPAKARKKIHYELGKLYDRAGEYETAFSHFEAANQLAAQQAAEKGLNKDTYLESLKRLAQFASSNESRPSDRKAAPAANVPVFLVGFPRSGTTLLEQILNSHPQIQTLDEKLTVGALTKKLAQLPGGYPVRLASLTQVDIEELQRMYYHEVAKYVCLQPGNLLADKLPLNIVHVPLLQKVFPNAKFLVAVRHPYDVVLSCFMQYFSDNSAMANFFTIDDAVHLYEKVMSLWQTYVRVFKPAYHIIKYESLVRDFSATTVSLLEFLGVPWDDAVLRFHANAQKRKAISTPSYAQVVRPIYNASVNRWRHYAQFLQPAVNRLAPFCTFFGYENEAERAA